MTNSRSVMDITPRPPIVFVQAGSWLPKQHLSGLHQGWAKLPRPFATADHRSSAPGGADQLQPAFYNDQMIRLADRDAAAGCIRCSSPTAVRRPTKAPSSWRANGGEIPRRRPRDSHHGSSFHGRTLAIWRRRAFDGNIFMNPGVRLRKGAAERSCHCHGDYAADRRGDTGTDPGEAGVFEATIHSFAACVR
jgi:hypothetical protein